VKGVDRFRVIGGLASDDHRLSLALTCLRRNRFQAQADNGPRLGHDAYAVPQLRGTAYDLRWSSTRIRL
jgi:hypothetical protein